MAKARAMCRCATCGCEFDVTAYRQNRREADSFESWAEENITECKDCRDARIAAERAEENARAAETAGERGWPVLEGTEKQAAWATTIREQEIPGIIEKYETYLARARETQDAVRTERYERCLKAVEYMLRHYTKASWWIDNRGALNIVMHSICRDMAADPDKYAIVDATEAAETEAQNDPATIAQPAERKHDGVVDIRASEHLVLAEYIKNHDFMELIKALGYTWRRTVGAWGLDITIRTGTAAERAAELGNRLLNAGYAIRIQDAETLRNAINGDYKPMTHRWIAKRDDRFFITWARDDDFYDRARKLPGAKYDRPGITIPAKEFEAVRDFAHTYDFKLTPGASELIDEMVASTRVVVPAEASRPEYDEHPVADILNTSRDVLEDLKD